MSGLVVVDKLSKVYGSKRGDVLVLDRTSFEIEERSFVSIVGPSGCGKTTLLRIVAGLTRASGGLVTVDQRPVEGPVRQCGFVFQSPVLLEWRTALDNVLLPVEVLHGRKDAARGRAHELLKLAGLTNFADHYPQELSGGMQQRVSICRALINDPKLLLMDEPFGALDALTREDMGRALLDIWDRTVKTVLFVTHSIDEAVYLSDRVLVMGHRPSSVLADLTIDLPRPRTDSVRSDVRFTHYCDLVRGAIHGRGQAIEQLPPDEDQPGGRRQEATR